MRSNYININSYLYTELSTRILKHRIIDSDFGIQNYRIWFWNAELSTRILKHRFIDSDSETQNYRLGFRNADLSTLILECRFIDSDFGMQIYRLWFWNTELSNLILECRFIDSDSEGSYLVCHFLTGCISCAACNRNVTPEIWKQVIAHPKPGRCT